MCEMWRAIKAGKLVSDTILRDIFYRAKMTTRACSRPFKRHETNGTHTHLLSLPDPLGDKAWKNMVSLSRSYTLQPCNSTLSVRKVPPQFLSTGHGKNVRNADKLQLLISAAASRAVALASRALRCAAKA